MNCSPESLRAFAQTAALGSFSAAARRLGKRQSTVSEAVARLEIDLGIELFDRRARQPVLTEAGRALLGRVQGVLDALDGLGRAAGQLAGGQEARLTLALSDAYQAAQYETRLTELDQRYPELEFECLIAEHDDLLNLVRAGRANLGLLPAQPAYPPELGSATVGERAEIGLFVANGHPLAQLPAVDQAMLARWRVLRLTTLADTERPIDDLPATGGRCWSAPNYLILLEMATQGFGWAALPRWLVSGYANGRLKELPVAGWPRSMAVDVIWSREHRLGPVGSWLLARLLEQ
jgi:DNA-binding transcriptional LysR family regulator